MVSLEQADACILQPLVFLPSFHTLCDDCNRQVLADLHNAFDNRLAGAAGVDSIHELDVELDVVGLEFAQQIESGVSRTEIVDRRPESQLLVGLDDGQQMGMVADFLPFGHLEDDLFHGKAVFGSGSEGRADAKLGLVHRVRIEIDVDVGRNAEFGRHLDDLHAASLIEAISRFVGQAIENARRGFACRSSDQSLLGKHGACFDVDDGLEGERKLDVQARPFGAIPARKLDEMIFVHALNSNHFANAAQEENARDIDPGRFVSWTQ